MSSVSTWQMAALGLTGLSILCVLGLGAWRMLARQRGSSDIEEATGPA